MTKLFDATVAAPIDLRILVNGEPQPDLPDAPRVAMIVCHGMGQQVPFETLDAVATAIADEHIKACGDKTRTGRRSVDAVLRFVRPMDAEKILPRAEITLRQDGQPDREVHLYEAYWAPLTEGAISYTQTVSHLLEAGFNGLRESSHRAFRRWMFGDEKELPIDPDTMRLLAVLLAIVTPILLLPLAGFSINSAIKSHQILSWHTIGIVLLSVFSYFIHRFVVQYMGDVIVYVSSNEVNEFWKIRDQIKQIGLSLAKVVYGAIDGVPYTRSGEAQTAPHFLYSDIVVVGHSLGSVVAYDTLNAIINQDGLDSNVRKVVDRTEAFITLGSPLDKIAFLFRQKAKHAYTRDVLAAAYQPMILDYKNRPRWWVNVFCRKDIISGSLEYFDDPAEAHSEPRRARNFADSYDKLNPVSAHTGYWDRPAAKNFLYLAATGSMKTTESDSFPHKEVKIRRAQQSSA